MPKDFHEFKYVREDTDGRTVRFFFCDYFTLKLWFDSEGISEFQLCYDRHHNEYAVTWTRDEKRVTHHAVDAERGEGMYAPSELLRTAELPFAHETAARFSSAAGAIPQEIHDFVTGILVEFAGTQQAKS